MNIKDNLNLNDMEVLCDWKHYKTIFFNLFQNAVKYNEKDGSINIDLSFVNINEMD
jgi:signal transduction histidine kinase